MLLVGAFVLDGTNGYHEESFCVSSDNQLQNLRKHATDTERENECQNTTLGPFHTTMKLKQGR